MKHWKVYYSVKCTNGRIREIDATLEAESIDMALVLANANIKKPAEHFPEVAAVVIYGIGIMEDDVF